MKPIIIKPEPALKKLWQTIWGIQFVAGIIVIFATYTLTRNILYTYYVLVVWMAIYIPMLIYLKALYKSMVYTIDSVAVRIKFGVFWGRYKTVPYSMINNVEITQGPIEKRLNIGKVHIKTTGYKGIQGLKPEIVLTGIRDCEALKNIILTRMGRTAATADEAEISTPVYGSDSEVLLAILQELTAIRTELEKKNTSE